MLGQNFFTNAFAPQTGLDKTAQSQIHWGLPKTVADCRQVSSHHQRRRQDKTVLSCRCWRCEPGIRQCTQFLLLRHLSRSNT